MTNIWTMSLLCLAKPLYLLGHICRDKSKLFEYLFQKGIGTIDHHKEVLALDVKVIDMYRVVRIRDINGTISIPVTVTKYCKFVLVEGLTHCIILRRTHLPFSQVAGCQ